MRPIRSQSAGGSALSAWFHAAKGPSGTKTTAYEITLRKIVHVTIAGRPVHGRSRIDVPGISSSLNPNIQSMKARRFFVTALLLAAGAAACSDNDKQIDQPQEPELYPITVTRSETYSIEVKDREKAGEKVEATVESLDQTMRIASVLVNGAPWSMLSGDDAHAVYTFTMPDKPVTLAAVMEKRGSVEPETYSIRSLPNDYCEIEVADHAGGGKSSVCA